MKARRLRGLLARELGYAVEEPTGGGSHRKLVAAGRPTLVFAFHDRDEIGPAMVRRILVRDVGLTLAEAVEVMKRA